MTLGVSENEVSPLLWGKHGKIVIQHHNVINRGYPIFRQTHMSMLAIVRYILVPW